MTATNTPTSVEQLQAKLVADQDHLGEMILARNEAAEAYVRGEIDSAALAQANAVVAAAELGAATTSEALEKAIAAEAERERATEQDRLIEQHASQFAGYKKAVARHERQLTTVETGAGELADFDRELRANRARLTAILDREDEIREDFQREYERLVREAPPGQVPNGDKLEWRQQAALDAMRAEVARQVDEALPLPDPIELDAIRARHASLAPLLLAPELRRALAEGLEFTRPPERAGSLGSRASFSGRIYADHEMPIAEARHAAFMSALQRLGGHAERIGAEYARVPGGLTVSAA